MEFDMYIKRVKNMQSNDQVFEIYNNINDIQQPILQLNFINFFIQLDLYTYFKVKKTNSHIIN